MVANHGLHPQQQSRDGRLSEKSESTIGISTPARIEDIFEWIEGIPLSKTTKNLARDFSDADKTTTVFKINVLMAEILKFYYPHLVSPHNYIPANSVQGKKDNWNTLNRKVLAKIDMQLCSDTIDKLSHSQVGAIDRILIMFRDRQMSLGIKETAAIQLQEENQETNQEAEVDLEDRSKFNRSFTVLEPTQSIEENKSVEETKQTEKKSCSIVGRCFGGVKNLFIAILSTFIAIVCFWRWFSRTPITDEVHTEVVLPTVEFEQQEKHDDQIPDIDGSLTDDLRDSYGQAVQEIRVKSEVIKTLCHKVAFLEGTMKLKDLKINTLNSQLELYRGPSSARASIGSTTSGTSHQQRVSATIRRRPQTQI